MHVTTAQRNGETERQQNGGNQALQTSADAGSCFKSSTRLNAEAAAPTDEDVVVVIPDEPKPMFLGRRRRLGS